MSSKFFYILYRIVEIISGLVTFFLVGYLIIVPVLIAFSWIGLGWSMFWAICKMLAVSVIGLAVVTWFLKKLC